MLYYVYLKLVNSTYHDGSCVNEIQFSGSRDRESPGGGGYYSGGRGRYKGVGGGYIKRCSEPEI